MAAEQQPAPETLYQLEAADGTQVGISGPAAEQSKTLSDLIMNLVDAADTTIPLSNISLATLTKVVEWCEHHKGEAVPVEDESVPKKVVLDDWDREFLKVDNEELFEIIVAANYLDIKQLLNLSCKIVADMAKGKTPEEMRRIFGIKSDEEEEEEEKKRQAAAASGGPSTSSAN